MGRVHLQAGAIVAGVAIPLWFIIWRNRRRETDFTRKCEARMDRPMARPTAVPVRPLDGVLLVRLKKKRLGLPCVQYAVADGFGVFSVGNSWHGMEFSTEHTERAMPVTEHTEDLGCWDGSDVKWSYDITMYFDFRTRIKVDEKSGFEVCRF